MQRIVVSWERSGFDWAFSGQYCVEYDSIEQFYCDLETAIKTTRNNAVAADKPWRNFIPDHIVIGGVEFECDNLCLINEDGTLEIDAEIKLLDDWFVDNYNGELLSCASKQEWKKRHDAKL